MDVFILGSGFSKDVGGMPLLKDLSEGVLNCIGSISSANQNQTESVKQHLEDLPALIQNNIEHTLTLLRATNPWRETAFSEFRRSLFRTLSNIIVEIIRREEAKTNQVKIEVENALHKLIAHWNQKNATIITFNYDTIIERKALSLLKNERGNRIVVNDLYVGPFTNILQRTVGTLSGTLEKHFDLIKLHGSINWYYSGNEDFSGEPIYFDPLFGEYSPESDVHVQKNKTDLQPLIIPPLLDKDPYMNHSLLRLQWLKAYEAIIKAENIYIIGYSLPETDLTARFMLLEAKKRSFAKWHVLLHHTDQEPMKIKLDNILETYSIHEVKNGESSIVNLVKFLEI